MQVALQLYTVRDQVAVQWQRTLKLVAKAGYRAIEFAGYPFMSVNADELKAFLRQTGLQPVSAHVSYQDFRKNPENFIRYADELGLTFLVTEPDVRRILSKSELESLAVEMEQLGMEVVKRGLRLAVHNHSIQFERCIDDKPLYWHLVEKTDPRYVLFQPDVYWIKYAGFDPVVVIDSLKGRCPLLHLKDMRDEQTKEMTEIGQGIIDFKKITLIAEKSGVEWH
ncbi:MAG: sugar phosphate isomerase/epimerase, partial [Thermofilaceae archaeon]